jgi:zinc protease
MKLLITLMLSAGILSLGHIDSANAKPTRTNKPAAHKKVQATSAKAARATRSRPASRAVSNKAAPAAKIPPKATPVGTVATKVASVEGITEYRLNNGLRVLMLPDASKPTITTNIVYMVGSRHENYGETGMAHLLEHLLFKPSVNFGLKKGSKNPVEVLNSTGAQFNGTTWYDRTNYYATFPANESNLRQLLELEADRMINATIDQNDLWNPQTKKGEMTVVRNEFERSMSDPIQVTNQRIQALAFDWHNYGKAVIGTRSDIEQVNIPRLRAFYRNYYQPDNAMLMVAGRFDEVKVLKQINDLFGRIPRPARVLQATYTSEPAQDGERSVNVRRSGGTQYLGLGYHVAPSGHVDDVAISLLGDILTDAPSGRLHKALVETQLASKISFGGSSNLEPGYSIFNIVVPKDGKLDAVQEVALKVIENLKAEPITEAELARAKQAYRKQVELATNDTAGLSIALTESMAAGDWRLFFIQRDQLEKVSVADLQAAANKYFKPSNRTAGRFIPTDNADRTEVPATPDIAALVKDYKGHAVVTQGEVFNTTPASIEQRTQRFTLPNGLKGALLPKKTKGGTVNLTLQLRLGNADSLQGKAQIGIFAAGLLNHGSTRRSREEIKDAFDKLKTQVTINGSAEGVTASITTVRENLAASIDLLADMLKNPAYSATEFQQFQRETTTRIEREIPEPQPQAVNAARRMNDPTPMGHIKHALTLPQQLAAMQAVKLDEVKAFHAAFYGANHANLAVVGDFDPAALKTRVNTLFGNWNAQQPYTRTAQVLKPSTGNKLILETPDKANSVLIATHTMSLKDSDPDYPALLIANYILGGGTLNSRLADRIRQKEGLSYAVGSQLNVPAQDNATLWLAFAISAPQNSAKVEAAMRDEIAKALREGFTEAELAAAKKGWSQSEEVNRTEDGPLATRLANYLSIDRTMLFDKTLNEKVAALSLAQVNAASREYLKAANISFVSAGDFAKMAEGKK